MTPENTSQTTVSMAQPAALDTAFANYRATKYFPCLDGLRCFSIVMVTAYHCEYQLLAMSRWGHYGVPLFFAISGYLITTLLLRERDDFGQISLVKFYARRSLRIFPLYYAVLAIYVFMIWRHDRHTITGQEFFHNIPYFATYTSNWFVRPGARFYLAWSLATEEQFYLLWPFLVAFARRARTPMVTMLVVLVIAVLSQMLWGGTASSQNLWRRIILSISPAICLGCLLAYALHYLQTFRILYPLTSSRVGVIIITGLLCLSLGLPDVPSYLVDLAGVGLVSLAVTSPLSAIHVALGNPIVRFVGTVSYGMYLFNLIATNMATKLAPSGPTRLLLAVSFAFAIAVASWFTYERIFRHIKTHFEARQRAKQHVKNAVKLNNGLVSAAQ